MANSRFCGRGVRLTIISVFLLPCISCGHAGPELHPVSGKVLFNGTPPEGATVVFSPLSGTLGAGLTSSGIVTADGTFTLQTFPHGAGAPAGDYIVLVSWFPPNARELENARNQLPAKYSDPSAAVLKATVKVGSNELPPFELK